MGLNLGIYRLGINLIMFSEESSLDYELYLLCFLLDFLIRIWM